MTNNTLLLGTLLTILGTGTYALVGFAPGTAGALLPAAFGLVFLLLGAMAHRRAEWRRGSCLTATALALLAFLGTAPGLMQALALIGGADVARPVAAMEEGIMAMLCLGFLGRTLTRAVERWRHGVEAGV